MARHFGREASGRQHLRQPSTCFPRHRDQGQYQRGDLPLHQRYRQRHGQFPKERYRDILSLPERRRTRLTTLNDLPRHYRRAECRYHHHPPSCDADRRQGFPHAQPATLGIRTRFYGILIFLALPRCLRLLQRTKKHARPAVVAT